MKRFLGLTILTLAVTLASHADPVPIPLWPNGAPGEKATSEPEKDMTTAKDGLVAGRSLIRLGNVTAPTMTVYPPANPSPSKTAVVVFPGGGYQILALDLEGTEVCRWLNSLGITAVLLKYRVPEPASVARHAEPLQDAQRAVGLVRAHASEWKINPNRIGVLGFSAGGHLAALLSNSFETRTYPPIDNADQVSCQPNFAVLVYPAYLSVKDQGEQLAPEVAVRGHTPPTFIVQAEAITPLSTEHCCTSGLSAAPVFPPKCTSTRAEGTAMDCEHPPLVSPPGQSWPKRGCDRWEFSETLSP